MKFNLILSLLLSALPWQTVMARTVDINVHGMTCPFCVDSLERKFGKMEFVNHVEVSLKLKKVRLETDDNKPSLAVIKQAVLDAGFTPVKIQVIESESKKDNADSNEKVQEQQDE